VPGHRHDGSGGAIWV
jgi:dipeptidyl aminopeptidase/acylaminoacyl peptidase